MKILIATGIYPPQTSGPAQYAKNMHDAWEKMGHKVVVKTYTFEHKLPTGIRHMYYFLKIIPAVIASDFIFALDTFGIGMPAVLAAKIFGKKVIIRTGGDFLWEWYVERTGDLVLLKDFYSESRSKWNRKERIIFNITKWTLHNVSLLIFSTAWQKKIFEGPYGLQNVKTEIVENRYGEKESYSEIPNKIFVAGTRPLKWKNIEFLKKVFGNDVISQTGYVLDVSTAKYGEFMEKMKKCYAVILVSLGDISPHMILDAIRLNKPFILTKENGLMDRIGSIAIIVDPKSEKDIEEKVKWLLDETNYKMQVEKIKNFNFTHTWEEIAREILGIYKKI